MIGETILHYKIIEKLGEVLLRLSLYTEADKTKVCFIGLSGSTLRNPTHSLEVIYDW
jgi:hypothetical protein